MAFKQARRAEGAPGGGAVVSFESGTDDLGLSFYKEPPNVEMSVRDFEDMAKDRLKLLHAIDRSCGYDTPLTGVFDKRRALYKDMDEARLLLRPPTAASRATFDSDKADFIRRDATSHFALRLAFCKTREAREWFVRQEQRLFVLRFGDLRDNAQESFLKDSGLMLRKFQAKDEAGKAFLTHLQLASPAAKIWRDGDPKPTFDSSFYELPFTELHPTLITKRQVVIKGGIGYVPSSALKLILAGKFKERLTASLDVAFQGLPMALADPRVGGFLRLLQDHGMQLLVAPKSSEGELGEKLDLANFEELLTRSFPPCMRRIVERQRDTKKHLKHAGRLQLRPFLKECGFTMDESFRWWKKELGRDPEVDPTSFEKNYLYDIEHTYGKKGHFQGQNAFGCSKIIGFPGEAAGQVHGCMFKQLDVASLKSQLHRWRIPEASAITIEKLITDGKHFQLACIEYFKAIHRGSEGDGVGNSPMDFYKESCKVCANKKAEKDKKGKSDKEKAAAIVAAGS